MTHLHGNASRNNGFIHYALTGHTTRRMHSSRIRTVCCSGHLRGGVVCPEGCLPKGVYNPPPSRGQTGTCKNINFPQLMLQMVTRSGTRQGTGPGTNGLHPGPGKVPVPVPVPCSVLAIDCSLGKITITGCLQILIWKMYSRNTYNLDPINVGLGTINVKGVVIIQGSH